LTDLGAARRRVGVRIRAAETRKSDLFRIKNLLESSDVRTQGLIGKAKTGLNAVFRPSLQK